MALTPVPSDPNIQTKVQELAGGDAIAVRSGGQINIEAGAALIINGVDVTAALIGLPNTKVSNVNQTTGSLPAGAITGALDVTLISTNATPGNQLCRTAAQMLADIGNGVGAGFAYNLRIINTGAGAFTLAADGGATVTLAGASMGVAQNTFKDFAVTFPTATTCTITEVGVGTYS